MAFAFFVVWRYSDYGQPDYGATVLQLEHVIESECTRCLHRSLLKKRGNHISINGDISISNSQQQRRRRTVRYFSLFLF